jgi:membrane-bound serine protease (ClpP class)
VRRLPIAVVSLAVAAVILAAPSQADGKAAERSGAAQIGRAIGEAGDPERSEGSQSSVDGKAAERSGAAQIGRAIGEAGDPERSEGSQSSVDVVEVAGYLDPVLVDFVTRAIGEAEADGVIALVLQLNSPGSVVSDADLTDLATAIRAAEVPVSVWIGPSGSRAFGGAAEIAAVTDEIGMAPGTRLGEVGEPRLPTDEFDEAFDGELADRAVGDEAAVDDGFADRSAPTVGLFVNDLEGFETEVDDGDVVPVTETRFRQLPLISQVFHTAASPAVAYLLFVLGMGLIVFELYTAGVGVAGVIGALAFLLGAYGLATLPARGWAVGLLVLAMVALCVDIQTGVPRFWTGVGFVAFAVGTLALYDGPELSWITVLGAFAALAVAALAGMPAMVRTRFSTPTIGREWMIGERGEVVRDIAPDGTVRVREALWRARTNRATPLAAGEDVVVAGIDGLVLEVESADPERRPKDRSH